MVLAQYAGQALARNQTDLGAHVLDADHHRQHRDGRPQRREAELGPGLGIRSNARWIVVRSAGDQARTEDDGKALERVPLGPESGDLWIGWSGRIDARFGRVLRRPWLRHLVGALLAARLADRGNSGLAERQHFALILGFDHGDHEGPGTRGEEARTTIWKSRLTSGRTPGEASSRSPASGHPDRSPSAP